MRLSKSIKIDDKEYTIKELTVKEILELFSNDTSPDADNQTISENESQIQRLLGSFIGDASMLTRFMKISMPGTNFGDLVALAPSELMLIWGKMKEVNTYFFQAAQTLELGEQVVLALREILASFSNYAVALSKTGMEQEFGTSDTLGSSKQLETTRTNG